MTQVLKIGGRYFQPAELTTARQDGWAMAQMLDAGIQKFMGKRLDEDEATAVALVAQVFRSGKVGHILAAALVEIGEKWTPESAEKNAEFFAEITDPADKRTLEAAFLPTLAGFFLDGGTSSVGSPSASVDAAVPKRGPRKRARHSTTPVDPPPAALGSQSPAS
jgi:hypothetical protein